LYCSSNVVQIIQSRKRWRGEERWWGNLNETDHLEDLGRGGITILKGMVQEIGLEGVGAWIGLH
jgi:hypothetical protein